MAAPAHKRPSVADYPHLLAEWHPTHNGSLGPAEVALGSPRRVWWKCSNGPDHEWQASPNNRGRRNAPRGCPFCAGRRLSVTNSLATRAPEIAAEWHPSKNGTLSPSDVVSGSKRRVWWQCRHDPEHVWETTINNRTSQNRGCPFCKRRDVMPKSSLARTHPELASQWLAEKNGTLRPEQVLAGSRKRVWWQCPVDPEHQWRATVYHRALREHGCPHCARAKPRARPAPFEKSLAYLNPLLCDEWHPTNNGELTPRDVFASSPRRVWWKCPRGDDHEWQASVWHRTRRGHGCPFCGNQRVSVTNCLAVRYPSIAAEWHPSRNGSLTPRDVVATSTKKVWWQCSKDARHEWKTTVAHRTAKGNSCPVCASRRGRPALDVRFPELAAQWHPTRNGTLQPGDLVPSSDREVWWKCPHGPDHEWKASPYSRTWGRSRCPFCSNKRLSVTNSLASNHPELAAEWHPTKNGTSTPDQIRANSTRRVWWQCSKDPTHEWRTSPRLRTGGRKTGCKRCADIKVPPSRTLATLAPDIARQWHPSKNGPLTASEIGRGSNIRVWWRCRNGPDHEWQTSPRMRRSTRCPFCAGRRASATNNLASLYPEIAAQWHPTRNGKLRPEDVVAASSAFAWWRCPRGHVWRGKVSARTVRGLGCPRCAL